MRRSVKEALESSGFFQVGKDWDVFLPGTVHPLTSGTALWLSTPALVSLQYLAVQRWVVFRSEAGSLPCRLQCSDPQTTDTGAGLKFYLQGAMESHLLWPCMLSQ